MNKLTLGKKTHTKTKLNLNHQALVLSTQVRSARMYVLITLYNFGTQYSIEQF